MKRCAVLGRGMSLRKYSEYSKMFENIYVVNSFSREIDILGIEHFTGKNVIQIVGRSKQNIMPRGIYEKLRIKVQCNSFVKFQAEVRFNKIGVKVLRLPGFMKTRGTIVKNASERGWPTAGILAVDFALCSCPDLNEIYLFGIDMYASDYLVKRTTEKQKKSRKRQEMFTYLSKIVREFSNCKFYCSNDVVIEASNWFNLESMHETNT